MVEYQDLTSERKLLNDEKEQLMLSFHDPVYSSKEKYMIIKCVLEIRSRISEIQKSILSIMKDEMRFQ